MVTEVTSKEPQNARDVMYVTMSSDRPGGRPLDTNC
jgi:hypothetical protein